MAPEQDPAGTAPGPDGDGRYADRLRVRHGSVRVVAGVPRGDRRTTTSLLTLGAEGKWLDRHRDLVRGRLLDAGCGNAPYEPWYGPRTTWSCRLDIAPLPHLSARSVAEAVPFRDETFDTVLSTSVLEHVDDLPRSLGELHRVLRPGGHLLATVPFMYPTHEAPHDFRRLTSYGIERSLDDAGFDVLDLGSMGGPVLFVGHLGVMAATAATQAVGRRLGDGAARVLRGVVTLPQEAVRPAISTGLGRGARRISLGYMAAARRR